MSSSMLSGKLECGLGPSASQHFEHKSSVLLTLLQFSHCKNTRLLYKTN